MTIERLLCAASVSQHACLVSSPTANRSWSMPHPLAQPGEMLGCVGRSGAAYRAGSRGCRMRAGIR